MHVDDEVRESPLEGAPTNDMGAVLDVIEQSWISL